MPLGPMAPINGMLCRAAPDVEVVGGTVVVVLTPCPVAWKRGDGADPSVGKTSVVVAASFVASLPRRIGWVLTAAAGMLRSTRVPAAPAAAAPASFSKSRRLCGASAPF